MGFFDFVGSLFSNAASAKQASAQRAFQEEMSDTAHQREVKDLTAAGLNPLLSVNSGASTPSGAMGSVAAPNIGNPIQEGIQTVGAAKQLAQTDATTDSIKAAAENSRASAMLSRANAAKALADLPEKQVHGDFWDGVHKLMGLPKDAYPAPSTAPSSAKSVPSGLPNFLGAMPF